MIGYYEVNIYVQLKRNISYLELPSSLSRAINEYFYANKELSKIHKKNMFKHYSFSWLTPIEKSYKKGKTYAFSIRFLEEKMKDLFVETLFYQTNDVFCFMMAKEKEVKQEKPILSLYTLTPALITIDKNRQWVKQKEETKTDLLFVREAITNNANKKYKDFLKKNNKDIGPDVDFISSISFLKDIRYAFPYKKGKMIGYKYKLKIKQDKNSQEMARYIMGAGLLEKNTLSFGFCEATIKE